jgi:hypothetical protein
MSACVTGTLQTRFAPLDQEGDQSYSVDFRYDNTDPAALRLIFHPSEEETVEWIFDLDLFGMAFKTGRVQGLGDVKIDPNHGPGQLCLYLSTPKGTTGAIFDYRSIRRLIGRIQDFAPAPCEDGRLYSDKVIDKMIASILAQP